MRTISGSPPLTPKRSSSSASGLSGEIPLGSTRDRHPQAFAAPDPAAPPRRSCERGYGGDLPPEADDHVHRQLAQKPG
ncbi:MAG TPA: hypothetical protein VH325_02970 [Bryobacteraceae bacterium]|nr:hypothetical protein [Bryobacteraceae bacterium]